MEATNVTDVKAGSGNPSLMKLSKWQYGLAIGATALAYFWVAKLSLALLNLQVEASPIWIPAGIGVAALLWFGRRMWVGIALGLFLLNHSMMAPWLLSAGSMLGSTLQALAGVSLLRWAEVRPSFDRLRDVLGFVGLAVLVAPLISATIGTSIAYGVGHIRWSEVGQNWWTVWLGDGMGILVFTPVLLLVGQWLTKRHSENHAVQVDRSWQSLSEKLHQNLERGLWLAMLVSGSWAIFYSHPTKAVALYPLEYLPFPIVIWAALRFGQAGAVLASFVLSCIAIGGTVTGYGPFVMKAQDPRQVVLLLQAFIGVVTVTSLVLATTMAERRQVEAQLRHTADRNRLLAEMGLRIRQSLDLKTILDTTVQEVRHFLQADRVFICQFDPIGQGSVVAESVAPGWASTAHWTTDATIYPEIKAIFESGRLSIIDDTNLLESSPFVKSYHRQYQVRASIAVPLFLNPKSEICPNFQPDADSPCLFGILIANQCGMPRQWEPMEIELLEQLGTQVTIAIQQAQLYQQVQSLNANLEQQVTERTLQLQANMAEMEQLNQLRDLLIHAIAHDLRTTVMGTLMVLQNLQKQPGDQIPIGRSLLERMVQSGDVQLNKLNALLEAYQNQTEGVVLQPQTVDLSALLCSVITELQPLLTQNQVTLERQIPADLPPISADSTKIRRVISQLLTNAIKHNPPGIQITLQLKVESGMLVCIVEDNGKGINVSDCPRLFDLRIGRCDDRKLAGISLGLSLCHQIITAHQGTIGVNSIPGTGSQFWFKLPTGKGISA
ncbi:MAG TPA: MASE1 domain-containing protein [Trichocoleus sp.]|jgi:signal transduction histidine kinase/integral membrane sensor domain MASE1